MTDLTKDNLMRRLTIVSNHIDKNNSYVIAGVITRITGMKLEATGLTAPMGTLCRIEVSETHLVYAEVIGFSDSATYLMAVQDTYGIKQGTAVVPLTKSNNVAVSMALLGRLLDATGSPIDHKGAIDADESYPIQGQHINPMERARIAEPLDVGIRVINSLLTVGKGQRIGIFAGSGVGKSVLLGMMTRFTRADVIVVGLIGERGREVKEFIEENLGKMGLERSVVVASPADTSPLLRVNGALLATTIAEYYRDQGLDVLLILDSLTRFAQAYREIALSTGEMPATKGFTASVFAKLSQLVERSGNGVNGHGSITAFYTVLVENNDHHQDPIADHARSILDGHIVLSSELADAGHYPAIDIEKSISRVMPVVVSKQQLQTATKFKQLYSSYQKNNELISIGMYQAGTNKLLDEAILKKDRMVKFMQQDTDEQADFSHSNQALDQLIFDANLIQQGGTRV